MPRLRLIESLSFGAKETGTAKEEFSRGVIDKSLRIISSLPSLPGLSSRRYRNETLLNLQRTKEYIPHVPRGQAALHTGNTSLLYPCELTTNIILMSFYQLKKTKRKTYQIFINKFINWFVWLFITVNHNKTATYKEPGDWDRRITVIRYFLKCIKAVWVITFTSLPYSFHCYCLKTGSHNYKVMQRQEL